MSVSLSINGIAVSVPEGATILQAAKAAGVAIPTLCHLENTNTISACRVTQSVGAIFVNHRAGETTVGFGLPLRETDCVSCGQCVRACPTGALSVRDDTKALWRAVYDREKYVVAALSPEAARSLGRLFGSADDPEGFGKAAALLRRAGVDLVLDSSAFASEFGKSVRAAIEAADTDGPAIQCTCFAARQFIERFYPALSGNILPLRHRRNALAARCKAELPGKNVFFVSIDGCLSAKTERARDPECPVDAALTARELFTLIRQCCVSSFTAGEIWASIPPEAPDTLPFLGEGRPSNARPAVTEKELRVGERVLRAAEVTGLGSARAILENASRWDYIKLDACPGGCASGGGMPRKKESLPERE